MKRPGEELFDLRTDPWQMNNLAYMDEYQLIKAGLIKQLQEYLKATGDPRETGETITWDTQEYYLPDDWVGKPRKEAQEIFGLKQEYSYRSDGMDE